MRGKIVVFPTLVGVFLTGPAASAVSSSLPHARGGVSIFPSFFTLPMRSSPRSWGCFHKEARPPGGDRVFPTLVGVFPPTARWSCWASSLPHARGGVSEKHARRIGYAGSSPRSWGCFHDAATSGECPAVFPTLVGVFLVVSKRTIISVSLPHARGGVSERLGLAVAKVASSPRSWGCFRDALLDAARPFVFPTLVGVFHRGCPAPSGTASLPHARGGVSYGSSGTGCRRSSSPRSWGCFQKRPRLAACWVVFPTLVGVFPGRSMRRSCPGGLPHARGGVSATNAAT